MPYNTPGNFYPQTPTNNNLWFGNNYASGYSQASRSMNNPMNPNNMMQPMIPMQQAQQNQGQQTINPQFPAPQTMNNIIEVMGPESANNFAIGPKSHVMLTDLNRPVIYSKESDDSGYSETRAFLLTEIPLFESENAISQQTQQPTQQSDVEYATKTDLEELKKFVEDLVMNNE